MAYTATVVSPMKNAERISRSMGIYSGKVAVSEYNTTLLEITAITKYFKPTSNATTGGFGDGIVSVQFEGPSSGGYLARWDYTTGSIKCFYADKSVTPGITLVASATVSALGTVYISTASGAIGHTGTAQVISCTAIAAAAASECVNAVNAGTFGFIAIGFV